jgi:hypothetical protein
MDASTLADRLFRNATAALEMYGVYLGERLGYYRALASGGPATPAELAERTGTDERYTLCQHVGDRRLAGPIARQRTGLGRIARRACERAFSGG